MPYWIEIHCSKKMHHSCNSNIQVDVPMGFSYNISMAAVNMALLMLAKEAKKLEWIVKDNDWICPVCKDK